MRKDIRNATEMQGRNPENEKGYQECNRNAKTKSCQMRKDQPSGRDQCRYWSFIDGFYYCATDRKKWPAGREDNS